MRLIANEEETNPVCRRYDPAKTPLQRVLLSGVLSPAKEQELLAVVQSLDPVRLLDQIEQLQYALFRCAVNASPFSHHQLVTPIQVFAWEHCTDGSLPPCLHPAPAGSSTSTKELPVECLLGWKRYRTNPFEEEWECIASCLQEHPDLTAAALFRQLQNRSPGRYHQGQLRCLQRGGRLIRTQLLAMRDDPGPAELIHGTLPAFVLPSSLALAESASEEAQVDSSEKDSLRAAPSLHRADRLPKAMCARHANGKQEISPEHSGLFPTDHGAQRPQDNPLAQAIQAYLQEQTDARRCPKTLSWHQSSLRQLSAYLQTHHRIQDPGALTEAVVREWLTFLQQTPTSTGALRSLNTIATSARSVRPFRSWHVRSSPPTRSRHLAPNASNSSRPRATEGVSASCRCQTSQHPHHCPQSSTALALMGRRPAGVGDVCLAGGRCVPSPGARADRGTRGRRAQQEE